MANITLTQAQRLHIPATLLTLAGCVLFPIAIHLIPVAEGAPMGARLLPIFYAPLLAIMLAHPRVGIVAAILAPAVNTLLTGMPTTAMLPVLTVELVTFSVVVGLLYQKWPKFFAVGLVGYGAAKLASLLLLTVVPLLPAPPFQFFTSSITTAIPGILVLLLLGTAVTVAKGKGDEHPDTA